MSVYQITFVVTLFVIFFTFSIVNKFPVCHCSRRLRGHLFLANIFVKTKKFAKLFLPVHMGARLNILSNNKNGQNVMTLSLSTVLSEDLALTGLYHNILSSFFMSPFLGPW